MWHQCLHFWSETFDVAQERTGVSYNVHLPGFQIWHIAILLSHLISRLEAIAIRLQAILLSHLIGVLFLQGSRVPCDSQIQGDGCWNQSPRIVGNTLLFWIQWHRSARICSLLESLISTTQFCLALFLLFCSITCLLVSRRTKANQCNMARGLIMRLLWL